MAENKRSVPLLQWLAAAVGAAILLLNPPNGEALPAHAAPLLVYLALSAVASLFRVTLAHDEISLAHAVGLVACLSMPPIAQSAALWAVATGVLIGEVVHVIASIYVRFRGSIPTLSLRLFTPSALGFAQAAIGFYAASAFYQAVGGALPLQEIVRADILLVAAACAIYVGVYGLFFTMQRYFSSQKRPAQSPTELLAALILPLPFAVLAAEAYSLLSETAFALLLAALTIVIVFMYGIGLTRMRLRRRMEEIESLAALSETIRQQVEFAPLLRSIEQHTREMMNVTSVQIALRQPTSTPPQGEPLNLRLPSSTVSSLTVPLIAGGKELGTLSVASDSRERPFEQDDLRRLSIIAAGSSVALESALRLKEQSQRVEQLATLNNILALLTGTLSPDAVLDTVITSASALSGASAVAVYLYWDDAGTNPLTPSALVLARSAGLSQHFAAQPPDPLLVSLAPKSYWSSQPPVVINDAASDPLASPLAELLRGEKIAAWIELPLVVGGVGLGVICLYFSQTTNYSAEEVELLRTFANQAAQAISNARLFAVTDEALERRVGQLLALAEIGQELIAIIDLNMIADIVLRHALDASRAGAGYLFLHSERSAAPEALAHTGYADGMFADASTAVQPAWSELQPGHTLMHSGDPGTFDGMARLASTRSLVAAPIARGRIVFGGLVLESDKAAAFSLEDKQFIGQLANQAVIAIDNARLFRRIAEALDRMQVILNAMDEAILLIDADGVIALANPRVSLLGLPPDELIGRTVQDVMGETAFDFTQQLGFASPADIQRLIADLRGSWTDRPAHKFTYAGSKVLTTLLRQTIPVYNDQGHAIGALLVFHDETEAARLEEARGDFSRMIVHDLRGPLTAITTSLSILTNLIPKDSPYRPQVETTTDSTRRSIRKLLGRVNALLDVARMESGQMMLDEQPNDIATLIDGVCAELSPLAHELNVTLVPELPDDLPQLDIDADKVERVLLNLLDNALKFSPLDSQVIIRASMPGTNGAPAGFARIDVIDSGPGINNDDKTRLFERFAQVIGRTGRRRGTGLGLTFAKLVTEAHGGAIWIEDNPAGGSIFSLTLPIA